jgi:hypothetical protein
MTSHLVYRRLEGGASNFGLSFATIGTCRVKRGCTSPHWCNKNPILDNEM